MGRSTVDVRVWVVSGGERPGTSSMGRAGLPAITSTDEEDDPDPSDEDDGDTRGGGRTASSAVSGESGEDDEARRTRSREPDALVSILGVIRFGVFGLAK